MKNRLALPTLFMVCFLSFPLIGLFMIFNEGEYLFGFMFVFVGVLTELLLLELIVKTFKVRLKGTIYEGTIIQHLDDNEYYIDELPALVLLVEYIGPNNKTCTRYIRTSSIKDDKYPIGMRVRFREYEQDTVLLGTLGVVNSKEQNTTL